MRKRYLNLLQNSHDSEQSITEYEINNVLRAARMGSQAAYDAIVEYYLNERESEYNEMNYPMITPSVAMLAASDKPSKFADSKIFSDAFIKFITGNPKSKIFFNEWSLFRGDWIENTYLKNFKYSIAPQLPRLVYQNHENDGFDDLAIDEYCPISPLSIVLFFGMDELSGFRINNGHIYNTDYNYLSLLNFYHSVKKEKIDELLGDSVGLLGQIVSTRWNSKILETKSLTIENIEQIESNKFVVDGVLKTFWNISVIHEILETCCKCSREFGYGGQRNTFGWMHLYFPKSDFPLKLTYVGKHILGSLISTVEVLKQALSLLEVDEDANVSTPIVNAVDIVFELEGEDMMLFRIEEFHHELKQSVILGQELLKTFPELEKYRNKYRDTPFIYFFDVEEWEKD